MDLVYTVRHGSNAELRYSLRSVAANLPHDRVWIVGHVEPWLTDIRPVETRQGGVDKPAQVCRNWQTFVDRPDCPAEFVIMNDDFFVMQPVDVLPVWHRGPLAEQAAAGPRSPYLDGLDRTARMLRAAGVAEPLSYELHIPMLVDRAGWRVALREKHRDPRLAPRSLYANFADLPSAELHADVKVSTRAQKIPDGPFMSTTDFAFQQLPVGQHIRQAFRRSCLYEQGGRP